MKHLLIAALFLIPLPALADNSVTITVVSDTGGGQTTQVWTMTPEVMQKFQTFVQNSYGCKPPAPGQECEQFSNDAMMAMWATATIQGTIDNVNRDQKIAAAGDAAGGVTPIPPQPPIDASTSTQSITPQSKTKAHKK